MQTDFTEFLLQTRLQKWYVENVIKSRNQYSNQAFEIPLTTYFVHYKEPLSALDLVYHGLRPLYATGKILLDPGLKFDEITIPRLDDLSPEEQVLGSYQVTLDTIEEGLQSMNIDHLEGELEEIRGDEEEFKRRLGIVTMHALNHVAQAIRFQGLICNELAHS